jgi:hypothetical protein
MRNLATVRETVLFAVPRPHHGCLRGARRRSRNRMHQCHDDDRRRCLLRSGNCRFPDRCPANGRMHDQGVARPEVAFHRCGGGSGRPVPTRPAAASRGRLWLLRRVQREPDRMADHHARLRAVRGRGRHDRPAPAPHAVRPATAELWLAVLAFELSLIAFLSPGLSEVLVRLGYSEPCEVRRLPVGPNWRVCRYLRDYWPRTRYRYQVLARGAAPLGRLRAQELAEMRDRERDQATL